MFMMLFFVTGVIYYLDPTLKTLLILILGALLGVLNSLIDLVQIFIKKQKSIDQIIIDLIDICSSVEVMKDEITSIASSVDNIEDEIRSSNNEFDYLDDDEDDEFDSLDDDDNY